jgi:endonuclease-3
MATSSLSKAALIAKSALIAELLEKYFPEVPIPLDHSDAFTLLVAVMLSAQSTDARVNLVTPALFAAAPNASAMAGLDEQKILDIIKTVGLAPTKARHLKAMAQNLVEKFEGQVPRTFAELESLSGVGHKTASVVMSQAFGVPAFPVDTHIHRLAARWGLSSGKNVVQTERDLKAAFPESSWNKLHLQMIYFGRKYCPARGHSIPDCPICRELESRV